MAETTTASVIPLQDFSTDAVLSQLEKILSHTEFARSPRIQSFLRYVVVETLEDRADYLKGYNIALAVFGRDEAFDPQSDPLVRVQAGRLRRMLTQYYLTDGKSDEIIINLPKGSYVPCVCKQQVKDSPRPSDTLASAPSGPGIAVLAFDNLSDDPRQDHFAIGLSDAIISGLTRFRNLFVLSRHTSFHFKHQLIDIRELAEQHNLDYLLEGSVRSANQQLRVTVQLIRTENSESLWSQDYDRDLNTQNILDIESDIAEKVIAAIAVPYGMIHQSERINLVRRAPLYFNAYELVQRFYIYWGGAVELHGELRDGLEKAVIEDPHYSDAWSALAFLYLDERRFNLNPRPDSSPALERALTAAQKAVELDANSSMAHQALFCAYFHRHEIEEFFTIADRALHLNPNDADMLADLGIDFYLLGEYERGLALAEKAMLLSPVAPGWYHMTHAIHYFRTADYKNARATLKQCNMADNYGYQVVLCATYVKLNAFAEAKQAAETAFKLNPALMVNPRKELRLWNLEEDLLDQWVDSLDHTDED